jgi:predicted nucleic acid-binding protein
MSATVPSPESTKMAVVDASVASGFFLRNDVGHERSVECITQLVDHGEPIVGPSIVASEVMSALRIAQVPEALCSDVLETLKAQALISLRGVDAALTLRAAEIAAVRPIRGCDAIHVALAEALEDELVPFDRQQARAAEGLVGVRQL